MPDLHISVEKNGKYVDAGEFYDLDSDLISEMYDLVYDHLTANMPAGSNWRLLFDDVFHLVEVDEYVEVPSFEKKIDEDTYLFEFEMSDESNNNNNNSNNNNNNSNNNNNNNNNKNNNNNNNDPHAMAAKYEKFLADQAAYHKSLGLGPKKRRSTRKSSTRRRRNARKSSTRRRRNTRR